MPKDNTETEKTLKEQSLLLTLKRSRRSD